MKQETSGELAAGLIAAALIAAAAAVVMEGCAVALGPTQNRSRQQVLAGQPQAALYYSDLGPTTIDVSSYPAVQQADYQVYARACSTCHTLARSINAPMVNRRYWEFYVLGMRFNTQFKHGTKMSKEDIEKILDFLEYDSEIRKVRGKEQFDKLTDRLETEFEPILDARIKRVIESVPANMREDVP
jgi:hypothetical protein